MATMENMIQAQSAFNQYIGFQKDSHGHYVASNQLNEMSLEELNMLYAQMSNSNKFGKLNDQLQALQMIIQQKYERENSDRDYERSLPANQVAQLRAAGMSRSGALSLLQNGGVSQTDSSLSPFQPVNNDVENIRAAANVTSSLVSAVASVVNLPAGIAAKVATTTLLNLQGNLLSEQEQGMKFAAQFEQACDNAIDSGHLSKDSTLSDRLAYFRNVVNTDQNASDFDFASYQYSKGGLFEASLNNPFFYSAVRNAEQQANSADASVYEPDRAREIVQSMQASKQLTQDQDAYLKTEMSILQRRDRREALVQQLQEDLDQVLLSTEKIQADFDLTRWERIINNISNWTLLDSMQVEAQIKELSFITDPVAYNQKLENLRSNEKVVASTLMHAQFMADVMNAAQDNVQYDQNFANDLQVAARDAMLHRELYGGHLFDNIIRSVSVGAQAVGAVASIIGAFKGTSLLPSVGMSTIRTFGNNETESHSVVESFGERSVQFHKYPHRLQD